MRLSDKAYNGEIGHCMGTNRPVCGQCLRHALYEKWLRMGEERESIILMVPRATVLGCELKIPLEEEKPRRAARGGRANNIKNR